jgi:hypothetical protein
VFNDTDMLVNIAIADGSDDDENDINNNRTTTTFSNAHTRAYGYWHAAP